MLKFYVIQGTNRAPIVEGRIMFLVNNKISCDDSPLFQPIDSRKTKENAILQCNKYISRGKRVFYHAASLSAKYTIVYLRFYDA